LNLGRLRHLVNGLIDELGDDSPVSVFLFSVKDVADITSRLPKNTRVDPAKVLHEFMHNAGDPPYEDWLLTELERLIEECAEEGEV